jgi:2',3'-cyclic-nucleotide 2'-phosphodiesterase (5'-nucleotidase family)
MRWLAVALLLMLAALPQTARAETATLTFLHVNDVYHYRPDHGQGGLAQLSSMIRAERRAHPGALVTFGGDLLSPSLASTVTHGGHMIAFLNGLGADVAVLGNHEFDFGPKVLAERIRQSRFPWLAANALGPGGGPCCGAKASVILTVHGIKIGFFGLITRSTAQTSNATGIRFSPEEATARTMVAALRARGAQVIVALTHLPLALDQRIARDVKGIDLILGGHDHYPVAIRQYGPPIVKAGENADWLAVVRMRVTTLQGGKPPRVTLLRWGFVANRDEAADPRLAPLVDHTDGQLAAALDRPVATLTAPLDTRTARVREGETAFGDLVADALRRRMGADVALINGGAIRGNRLYPAGTVFTVGDLHRELPFGDTAVLLDVTGAQLRAALENGLSEVGDRAGRFPQLSGLTLSWAPDRPPYHRLIAVKVGGAPLDPLRHYRLATTDFIADGHDGYTMFRHARVIIGANGGPLLTALVAQSIAGRPLTPHTDGRIRCAGGPARCGDGR